MSKISRKELRSLINEMMLNEQIAGLVSIPVDPMQLSRLQDDLIASTGTSATGFGQRFEELLRSIQNPGGIRIVFGIDGKLFSLNNMGNAMFADLALLVNENQCVAYSVKASRSDNFEHETNTSRLVNGMVTAAQQALGTNLSGKSVVAGYIHGHAGSHYVSHMTADSNSPSGLKMKIMSGRGSFDAPADRLTFPDGYDAISDAPGYSILLSDPINADFVAARPGINTGRYGKRNESSQNNVDSAVGSSRLIENGTADSPININFTAGESEELVKPGVVGRFKAAGRNVFSRLSNMLTNESSAKSLETSRSKAGLVSDMETGLATAQQNVATKPSSPGDTHLRAIKVLGENVRTLFTVNSELVVYTVSTDAAGNIELGNPSGIDRLSENQNVFNQLINALKTGPSNGGYIQRTADRLPAAVRPSDIRRVIINFGEGGADREQIQVKIVYVSGNREVPYSALLPKSYHMRNDPVALEIIFPVWRHLYSKVLTEIDNYKASITYQFPTLQEIFADDSDYHVLKGEIIKDWGRVKARIASFKLTVPIGAPNWERQFVADLTSSYLDLISSPERRAKQRAEVESDLQKINDSYEALKKGYEEAVAEIKGKASTFSFTEGIPAQSMDELFMIGSQLRNLVELYNLKVGPDYVRKTSVNETFKKYSLLSLLTEQSGGDDSFSFEIKGLILNVISLLESIAASDQYEPLAEAMLVLGGYKIPEGGFFNSIQTEPASMSYLKDVSPAKDTLKDVSPAQDASFFDSLKGFGSDVASAVGGAVDTATGYVDDFFSSAGGVPALAENNHKKYSLLPLLEMMDGGMGPMDPGTVEDPFDVETLAMGDSEERSLYDEILMAPTVDIDDEDDLDSDGDGIPNDEDPEDDSGAFGAVMERFMQRTLIREAKHKIDQDESEEGLSHGALLKKKYYGRY